MSVAQLTRKTMSREVIATRDGICRRCTRPIEAGNDYVAKVDGVGWMHALCAREYRDLINEEVAHADAELDGRRAERFRQICRELRDLDAPEPAIAALERRADELEGSV